MMTDYQNKEKKMTLGYYVDGEEMICNKCSNEPEYQEATLTEVDMEGWPDGFTCVECGDEVGVPEDVEY